MVHVLQILRMVKGTSRDEAMLNSEKIKPLAISIVELCLPASIKLCLIEIFYNSIDTFWKGLGLV